jgi:hydrogenase-4 component B
MALLVLADGVYPFLFAWEAMALISFFLVMGDGANEANRRSAFIYAVMTHAGTAFLILAFMLLGRHAGSLEFEAFRDAAPALDRWERNTVFFLLLIGFSTKAGLVPLHIWLPRAHPAAPSHGSALMSGVMVKTAIFGMILFLYEFITVAPLWWGGVLIAVGAASAVLGILYSLMERDMKRLLAYSTVENVGIVTIGVGASLLLRTEGHATASALALMAALFHAFNHALFKSLLFFVAGAVQNATGTRDLERLGGLIRGMPATAGMALLGSVAIAALPPLNGFAGEWMLFQSLLELGHETDSSVVGAGAAIAVGSVALTGALAVAGFVRLFGMSFLAQPRTDHARDATEAPRSMLIGMGLLGALCVVLGLVPMIATRLLRPVTTGLTGGEAAPAPRWAGSFASDQLSANYVPVLVVIGLIVVGIVPWIVARRVGGPAVKRVSPTWVCGNYLETRMQYTATAFAKPLRIMFHAVVRPVRTVTVDRPASPYVVGSIRYEEQLKPVYERYLYEPVVSAMVWSSHWVRSMQSGSIRLYLAFFFATLLVVIVLAR